MFQRILFSWCISLLFVLSAGGQTPSGPPSTGDELEPQFLVSPQVVSGTLPATGERFETQVQILNSSDQPCPLEIRIGPNKQVLNETVFVDGSPFLTLTTIPPLGARNILVEYPSSQEVFQGGVIVQSDPSCLPHLSVGTSYRVEREGELTELFSYAAGRPVPPGGCVTAPVQLGPAGESFSTPGVAIQGVNQLPGGSVCLDFFDSNGNPIGDRECMAFDGDQLAAQIPTLFPDIPLFTGSLKLCNETPPDPALLSDDIFPLFIDVTQQRQRFQFRTIPLRETGGECTPDDHTLCLLEGRFRVQVDFVDAPQPAAVATQQPDGSGLFNFFDPENAELLVKVFNGCPVNNFFWVFAGSLTDVKYTIRVTDTRTDQAQTYLSPIAEPFQPFLDTQAFARCP